MSAGMRTTLTSQLGRISAPAREIRNMLGIAADAVMAGFGRGFAGGATFWVDGGSLASDSNNGCSLDKPLASIKAALALCTSWQNDVIFVGPQYWQPATEDWPILVNKMSVHIIGLALPNLPAPAIHPDVDKAAFEFANTGQVCELAYFTIGGGSAHGGVETGSIANGMGNGLYMHHCSFGHEWFGTPLAGFRNLGTINACAVRIEECKFFGDLANCVGKISGTAIDNALGAAGYWDKCEFINNIFMGCAMAIHLYRARDCMILGNKGGLPDSADGELVMLQADCVGNLVDGNIGMAGGDAAMTKNPFRDLAASSNNWGHNLRTTAAAGDENLLPKST